MESFTLDFTEALRGETTMSELLVEYGIETRWHRDTIGLVTRLIVQSLSLSGIGSSRIRGTIGKVLGNIRSPE
jgi:hypothetical protein